MASTLTTVSAIERELSRLRFADSGSRLRTSVMTHIAWVPEEWVEAMRDRLLALLGTLARHRQRGADLVYEAYAVDIGGTG